MKTSDVGYLALGNLSPEPWNSCIVTYEAVTIDSANADGSTYHYGESYGTVSSKGNHTRITWSDGRTQFYAGPTAVAVNKGDKFASIIGILGYTHNKYKLCPRNIDDIVGYVPTGVWSDKYVIPVEYKLNQNYPNPFNPSTIIRYTVKTSSLVTLKVYNLLGKEVAVLLNEDKQPGEYEADFSAGKFNLSSGVYFYRLTAGSFTSVKKMVLLK